MQESRALAPDRTDTLLFLAELERDAGNTDAAIGHYRALLAAAPGAAQQALDLARLLAAGDAYQEVIDLLLPFRGHVSVELRLMLARALFEAERHAEVVEVTGPLVKDAELELRGSFMAGEHRGELIAHMREATELHDDSFATLHGREKVIEADVHRGRLVANSGANYRLLGEARMAIAPAWTPDTALRDVDGTVGVRSGADRRRRAIAGPVSPRRRRPAPPQVIGGARPVREGARPRRRQLRRLPGHRRGDRSRPVRCARAHRAASRGARRRCPPALAPVLVDWPVLTPAERVSVFAAVAPLARQLPAVAAAGGIVRVLPIDARLVDLPEFSDGGGERLEDERCLDAITGAATPKLCASKVEEQLIFSGERGWVFAHELAHLVHFHLPDERCDELEAMFEEIDAQEFVLTNYQTRNVAEFFAVAYEDYLCDLYALPSAREGGLEHLEPVFAFIDAGSRSAAARARGGAGRGGARPRSARSRAARSPPGPGSS